MTATAGEAVLFDLFDTLVLFQRERLPEIEINGRVVRSTAGPSPRGLPAVRARALAG